MTTLATDRPTLSSRLREGTRDEHESAESSGFISRLMAGDLSTDAYVSLASQQYFVYSALEAITDDVRRLPQGESLIFAELARTPSIVRDLEHLVGSGWQSTVTPLPATLRYVDALHASSTSLPRYAAHAYTRYLGDLSGGQIIKRMLERHYGLGPEGITFYSFEEIPRSKPFKDVYRERLDGLDLDEEQLVEAVAEAKAAFRLNQDLFGELGALHR